MMSRTFTHNKSTVNSRGRGRGRGRERSNNYHPPTMSDENVDYNHHYNERRVDPLMFPRNQGIHSPAARDRGRERPKNYYPPTMPDENLDYNYHYNERRMNPLMFPHNQFIHSPAARGSEIITFPGKDPYRLPLNKKEERRAIMASYGFSIAKTENSVSPIVVGNNCSNVNKSQTSSIPELMERNIAGRNHFNVQSPVRDLNERVVSRDEALEKIQAQYEIERAKAEAKKKEKDAKKREEYLKRYQHVDQGRRLNEGLLDEAAGYNQVESLEEIRRRQQEKLRQEAAAYEERIREEQDRQKRKEEQKMKERLERNKNYDAGYRLNHGNNRGYNQKESLEEIRRRQQEKLRQDAAAYEEHIREEQEQQKRKEEQKKKELEKNKNYDAGHRLHRDDNQENTKKLPSTGALNKRPNQNKSYNTEDDDRQTFGASISPELLLEGETEEEFLQRQEEQLILEMIIQGQMELQAQKAEALEKNDISNDFEEINAQISPPKPEMKSNSEKTAEEKFGHNKAQTSTKSEMNPFLPKKTAQGSSTSRWRSSVAQRLLNQPKATSNDVKISSTNPPENIQERNEPDQLIIKPAACILKNKSEAVLVLRPSTEELNQALARKLEVLDEADKLGYSVSYKPHVEQKPLYSNNRFDIKSQPEGLKPTGAIPKNRPLSSTTVPVSSATKDSPSINTPAQREEPIDYQAELRAARLRFEQQYQERLKQIQEQNK